MAISWGAWAAGQSGSKSRLGIDRTISSTSTSTTVNFSLWIEFSGYYATGTTTLSFSGGHTGTTSVAVTFSGSGTRKLGDFGNAFSRPYGSSQTKTTNISLTGFAGGSPTLSTSYTIPRRLYSTPAVPSSVTVSRVSDTEADVSWAATSTTSAPVQSVNIIRQVNDGDWVYGGATVNKANGTLRVGSQSRGNRYRWAVKSQNIDAESNWAYSSWFYQRPLDVANVVAERSGSNVVVSWVDRNAVQYGGFRIYDNDVEVATVTAGTTTWTHVSPSTAVAHTYKVEAYYGSLTASKITSNTVQLLAAPLAPTDLAPDGGHVVAGTSQSISWTHNPTDGSAQTAYQVQMRRVGTTTWTTYSGTSAQTRTITVSTFASDGQAIEWQVRTKGAHVDYSPWSPVASFGVASRPTVTISSPTQGQAVSGSTVSLSFTISRTPASWTVELRRSSGQLVYSLSDYALSSPVTRTLTGLNNNESYTIKVVATDKVDSLAVSRTINVAYAQPPSPTLTASWDVRRGAVMLTATAVAGTPTASSLVIEQETNPGVWAQVALMGAPGPYTIPDPLARLDGARYRAIAVAIVNGQSVASAPTEIVVDPIPELADYLTWDGERTIRLRYRPSRDLAVGNDEITLVHLDDGTPDPYAIIGRKEYESTALSARLIDDGPGWSAHEQARDVVDMARWKGLVTLRTADGTTVEGIVSNVAISRAEWGGYDVSLTHTKAR